MAGTRFACSLAAVLFACAVPAGAQDAAGTGDTAGASARLDALDARIGRLEDMNAVERLQRTYGYLVDKSQWEPLAELFSEDGTLEIGGRGVYTGRERVLAYMQTGFGQDGHSAGQLMNHMQFQPVVDISEDGTRARLRSRAYVMSNGGWGLPLYENEFVKEDGVWKISRLMGPFIMYAGWEKGWKDQVISNTWPGDRDLSPPDLPPSVVYLMYPSYYIVPYHYANPVSGKEYEVPMGEAGVITPQR
jgi:hypothetical protein